MHAYGWCWCVVWWRCCAAAYSPSDPGSSQRQSAALGPLFLMMGRALQRVSSVPAGNVLAIAGANARIQGCHVWVGIHN